MRKPAEVEQELAAAKLWKQVVGVMEKTRRLLDAAAATRAWCIETRQSCRASAKASRFTISVTREMRELRRAREPATD